MNGKYHAVCLDIRATLLALRELLGRYEQTCHARVGPCGAVAVGELLAKCYNDPTAFNVSELSQAIAGLLEDRQ